MPFRIKINGQPCMTEDQIAANITANAGEQFVKARPPHEIPLAIVGGGNSAKAHLDELRAWPGHIWAINGTCAWLAKNGIKSVFFTCDPCDETEWNKTGDFLEGVETALIATSCDPFLFARLKGKAFAFNTRETLNIGLVATGGSTSAIRAQTLSLQLGFHNTSYFGCEGSWDFNASSHQSRDDIGEALIIRAGGKEYVTNLQMMCQSEELSNVIRGFPEVFKDRSGGLLGAMIEHRDTWEIVALSAPLRDKLDPTATELYQKAA